MKHEFLRTDPKFMRVYPGEWTNKERECWRSQQCKGQQRAHTFIVWKIQRFHETLFFGGGGGRGVGWVISKNVQQNVPCEKKKTCNGSHWKKNWERAFYHRSLFWFSTFKKILHKPSFTKQRREKKNLTRWHVPTPPLWDQVLRNLIFAHV